MAFLFLGSIRYLFDNLILDNEQVCRSAAVALGYLSFNGSGAREMLMICRNTPGLYTALERNLGSGKMSMEFVDSWRRALNVGLPSKRLEFYAYLFLYQDTINILRYTNI